MFVLKKSWKIKHSHELIIDASFWCAVSSHAKKIQTDKALSLQNVYPSQSEPERRKKLFCSRVMCISENKKSNNQTNRTRNEWNYA